MKTSLKITMAISLATTLFSAHSGQDALKKQSQTSIERGAWSSTPYSGITSPAQEQRTMTLYKDGKVVDECLMYKTVETRAIDVSDCPWLDIDKGKLIHKGV